MEKDLELFVQAAEQLEDLRAHLEAQKGSSERLKELTVAVGKIADQVGRLPAAMESIIERATLTEDRLNASAQQFQEFRDSFPSIVEKLENSDYGQAISSLFDSIEQLRAEHLRTRGDAASIQSIAGDVAESASVLAKGVDESLQKLLDVQVRTNADMATVREQLESKIDRLTELVQSVASQSKDDTKSATARQDQFFSVLTTSTEAVERLAEKVQAASAQAAANASATAASQEQLVSYLKTNSELQMSLVKGLMNTIEDMRRSDVVALRAQVTDLEGKLDAQTDTLKKLTSKKGIFFS